MVRSPGGEIDHGERGEGVKARRHAHPREAGDDSGQRHVDRSEREREAEQAREGDPTGPGVHRPLAEATQGGEGPHAEEDRGQEAGEQGVLGAVEELGGDPEQPAQEAVRARAEIKVLGVRAEIAGQVSAVFVDLRRRPGEALGPRDPCVGEEQDGRAHPRDHRHGRQNPQRAEREQAASLRDRAADENRQQRKMDHVGEIAAAREVEQIEEEEESGVPQRPPREQAVPEPEGEREPLDDQDLDMGELAIAERGERIHPPGQPGREPRDAAPAEHPADRQRARHERREEQEVVAGDGVGDDLQEQEELRRRPQEVIGERQGAPRGVVDVGVPDVRQPEPDLMGSPLEHVESEQRIAEIRPEVVPREARQRPEIDARDGRVEQRQGQPRQQAAGGGFRGLRSHGAGSYRTLTAGGGQRSGSGGAGSAGGGSISRYTAIPSSS